MTGFIESPSAIILDMHASAPISSPELYSFQIEPK